MTTLAYSGYVAKDITRAAVRAHHRADPQHQGYFGLSPFDVPLGVSATIFGEDVALFDFEYANAEPAERTLRPASLDRSVDVVLGSVTHKVLQVFVHEPRETLRRGAPAIELSLAAEWGALLPSHAAKTSFRSAELVNAIFLSMPASFRKAVIQAIEREVAADPQHRGHKPVP